MQPRSWIDDREESIFGVKHLCICHIVKLLRPLSSLLLYFCVLGRVSLPETIPFFVFRYLPCLVPPPLAGKGAFARILFRLDPGVVSSSAVD